MAIENSDSKLDKAAEATREALQRARQSVAHGADSAAEFSRTVATEARERANLVARVVREAEPDAELRATVRTGTERVVERAGDAVRGAAPTVGRGAEFAVDKVGAAIRFVARPVAAIVGAIAGTAGGWWKRAAELKSDLPEAQERECRSHFLSLEVLPVGVSFDDARSGYAVGYVAGCNPEYRGRTFADIEPDLLHGFADATEEYELLREFARFGYDLGVRTQR